MGKKRKEYYGKDQVDLVVSLIKKDGYSARKATRAMCDHFNLAHDEVVERAYRQRIKDMDLSKAPQNLENTDEFKKAKSRQYDSSKQRFLVSWAQAETAVHSEFLENMEAYAEHIGADIHIIAGRYKSPTSLEASKQQEKKDKNKNFWDKKVTPYLDANRQNIHPCLSILGDVKIQPTASTPLSGLNGMTGLESCIVGAPAVHLKSLPVLDGYPNKLLLTTGAVTIENYTDTKAGKKGEFHHQLGFVIVELDGDVFHLRQVQADSSGTFYDLHFKVKQGRVRLHKDEYPALVWGDVHYGHHNAEALNTALKMAYDFAPKEVILHDIFDAKSISHHELNNPFIQLVNEADGSGDLVAEIDRMIEFLDSHRTLNFVAVRSNHDDFLDRWLVNTDWRKQPNRAAYLMFAMALANGEAPKGIIPYVLETRCKNVKALGINDSHRVGEWELGIHGHLGASGSRGSAVQFQNLNTKNITGHTHQPLRLAGHLSVGTLTNLRVGYNNGASAWAHSCVIIYPNNKASHINIFKGRYTTLF